MTLDRRIVLGGLAAAVAGGSDGWAAEPSAPFLLEAKAAKAKLRSPAETDVLAFDGTVPGPLLRVKKGAVVSVRLKNALARPTTLSWHGVRNLNAMDGVSGLTQPAVVPGGTFDYRFTPPDAGLYWYHPHAAPETFEQTARGLHGVLIVDEADPPEVDEDVVLLVADWPLDSKGALPASAFAPSAAPDPTALVTVNGRAAPLVKDVRPGARLRLRLVNACASRIAIVGVTGASPSVIAIDGQPSELFQPAGGTVPIGPGSRFELMLDAPLEVGADLSVVLRATGGQKDQPLLAAKTTGKPVPPRPPIARLPENPLLPTRIALEKSSRHDMLIAPAANGRWSVNGVEGPSAKPLFTVARGTPVTLTFRNKSDLAQQMHVHGHCWRLLHDLDDGWDPYWRDSVLLAPGKAKHVAFVADNPGRWALVSGDLRRQVGGLATWFEVR